MSVPTCNYTGKPMTAKTVKSGVNVGKTFYSCSHRAVGDGPRNERGYCTDVVWPEDPRHPDNAGKTSSMPQAATTPQAVPGVQAGRQNVPTGGPAPPANTAELYVAGARLKALEFAGRIFSGSANHVDALLAAQAALKWLRNPGAPIEPPAVDSDIPF